MGIIGTGLLAIPVLAGSAAYATSEALGWNKGLERSPKEAIGFYSIIGLSVAIGVIVVFSPLDPMKALFWSAVLNGIISVPIMAAMMVVASSKRAMGKFTATLGQRIFGWAATSVMAAAAVAMAIF
jgi:Mn2+/Fe2+ NRAMP family transporter